jgi:hypothetical protein
LVADSDAADEVRDPSGHGQPANPAGVIVAKSQRDPVDNERQTDQRESEAVDTDIDPADLLGGSEGRRLLVRRCTGPGIDRPLESDTVDRWQDCEGGPSRYRGRKSETRYGRRCIRPDRKE